MAVRLQAKLLQVLQDEEFFRVGGKKSVRVDARVVVATNRELEREIENGNFREDLFYRLNVVSIRIQPDEGMSLRIASKLPGPRVRIFPVRMDFRYGSTFGESSPEAYEGLQLNVMAGDATLFMRREAVEASWAWVKPIQDAWENSSARWLPEYPAGSWGPLEADRMIQADGRAWRTL